MKIVTWNVNGIRACIDKGFMNYLYDANPDIICLQETKISEGQINMGLSQYTEYWNYADKAGYSGTAIFTKQMPMNAYKGFVQMEHNHEGRCITLEYDKFYLVNVYSPNSQKYLARLPYRLQWEEALLNHIDMLSKYKPVILCGDLNVAHEEIDLARPDSNHDSAGFSWQERYSLTTILKHGYVDAFRQVYPDVTDAYSYWSYMRNARENNVGWRLDYFIVAKSLSDKIQDVIMRRDILGSDHGPVELYIDL